MNNKKKIITAVAFVLVAGTVVALSLHSTTPKGGTPAGTASMSPQEKMMLAQNVNLIDTAHYGKVQVLADGTQIMLAPKYVREKGMFGMHYVTGEGASGVAGERNSTLTTSGTGFSKVDYNVDVLQADKRGCAACHTDLVAALNAFDPEHAGLASGDAYLHVKSLGVSVCRACHTEDWNTAQEIPNFGEMIHTMHGVDAGEEKATCFQCHATVKHGWPDAEAKGIKNLMGQKFEGKPTEWKLWDEVKYDQMKGINMVPNIKGDFSFTQDQITPTNQIFNETWLAYTSAQIAKVAGDDPAGLDKSFGSLDDPANSKMKDDIFSKYQFGIKGSVKEAKTWKLGELIDQATKAGVVKTVTMKEHCGITKLGGWQVANVQVTGIPVKWLLEQAGGATPDAKWIDGESLDSSKVEGFNMGEFIGSTPIKWLEERNVLVVYEINGKKLDWAQGFPLQLWVGGAAADAYMKQITNVVITNDQTRMGTNTTELALCMGPIQYPGYGGVKANCAITNTYEGQVVTAGKPYTFEGYLDGWYEKVGGIMVSLDNGITWTKYATPNADVEKLVNWKFTWDVPDSDMAYVLDVKPYLADGSTTADSVRVMINAVKGGVAK